jgi:D-Tyr-tRNAtyr deacylase
MENASKKNESFKEYPVFEHSTQKINSSLKDIAPDIQSISVSKSALSTIQKD